MPTATQVRQRSYRLSASTVSFLPSQRADGKEKLLDPKYTPTQEDADEVVAYVMDRFRHLNLLQRASRHRAGREEMQRRLVGTGMFISVGFPCLVGLCHLIPPVGITAFVGAMGISAVVGGTSYFTIVKWGYAAGCLQWDMANGYYDENIMMNA